MFRFFENSALLRFAKKCYGAMFSGFFGTAFTNYSKREKAFEDSIFGRADASDRSWQDTRASRLRRRIIVSYENSRIIGAIRSAGSWLLGCSLKFYGFFFMYFGFCIVLVTLFKHFAILGSGSAVMTDRIIGALLVGTALPMLLSSKTLADALDDSIFFSFLVKKVLGFSETELHGFAKKTDFGSKRYFIAAVVGSLFGCATYYINTLLLVGGMTALPVAFIIYTRPDVGLILAVFAAPFMSFLPSPSILLALAVIFITVCTLIRVFLGKIVVKIEITDFSVALFMLIMLMGGLISVGGVASLKEAAIYVCFMFVYFLTVTLITSEERLRRISLALVWGGTLTSLYGIWQKLSGNMETGTVDKEIFSDIEGRVASTFENSNMLGVFLIMAFPFALSFLFGAKTVRGKLLSLSSCGAMGLCLIYTWSRGAWLGLIGACLVFIILYSYKIIPVLFPAGLLGVAVFRNKLGESGIFDKLINRFASIITMSDSSSVYRLGIWRGALGIIRKYWLTGIGVGAEAFGSVYILYAESGIESAFHSHNLFLQILIETGITGLIAFLVSLIFCVKSGLEVVKNRPVEKCAEKAAAVAGISALFAALLQAMTDYIWFNYRIFFIFWTVAAIISASSKIMRKKSPTDVLH